MNRFFYAFAGGPSSFWETSNWSDERWQAHANNDRLRTWIASCEGSAAGHFALRQDDEDRVEIDYFGLAQRFIGRSLGGPLLTWDLEAASATQPARFWVHTSTLDHPTSPADYLARGMKIYRTELENNPPNPSRTP